MVGAGGVPGKYIKVMIVISKLLIPAITKLAQGLSMTLAMMIGTVKRKVLRPSTTCSGSSENAKIAVRNTVNNTPAILPDQKRFIKKMTMIPAIALNPP
jgi:hypothetical protein